MIKVILLDKIEALGSVGSIVIVKPGYARNFLIPYSKAILATEKNLKFFKEQQILFQSKSFEKQKNAESDAKKIEKIGEIIITARSGIKGKLFGSIGSREIAKKITGLSGVLVSKSQIRLPNNDVLKFVGIYRIIVHIYNDISVELNLQIVDMKSQHRIEK